MCRWLAYSGSPIALQAVLRESEHSLIDQSLHAQMGVQTTNGDGFGVGWYGEGPEPARLSRCGTIRTCGSSRRIRQVRAVSRPYPRIDRAPPFSRQTATRFAIGNGCGCTTARFATSVLVKRDLMLAVDPDLYPSDRRIDGFGVDVLSGPFFGAER